MRRATVIVTLCVAIHTLTASQANAHILRWIDELSGPGPFVGGSIELRVKCWKDKNIIEQHELAALSDEKRKKWADMLALGLKSGCPGEHKRNTYQQFSLNVETGYLHAKERDNPITYDDGQKRGVNLVPVEVFVYWQPTLGLELGTGGGFFLFFKKGLYYSPVFVLEPMRVDIRPLDVLLAKKVDKVSFGWNTLRALTFRQSFIYFPNRMTAADFAGGANNTFDERGEVVKSFAVLFDLEPFFRKNK
jgi:hypothetical protein